MSAILGIWHRDGKPVDPDVLHKMMAPLAFRGPDRSDIWISEFVAFGHHHMAMTPESVNERLPLTHPSGNWTIVADARLDNRDALLPVLGRPASDPMPDSEIILLAYLQWGEECVKHLLGDFAFAIWDNVTQQMFCARDHMGVRPFYYHATRDVFVFASGINAIRLYPGISLAINEGRLAELLIPSLDNMTETCHASIGRLPAAHTMKVTSAGVETHKYWALDSAYELPAASDEEYAEELRNIFTKAVARRVRSAYPLGATLSGGLDTSSTVVTARNMANVLYPGQLHTFSAGYAGLPHDESKYFNAVIEQGGIVGHVVECGSIQPFKDMPRVVQMHGELFHGANICIQTELYPSAQRAGIRGLLEGFDGDTTIGHGVDRPAELAQQNRWLSAIREARALALQANAPVGKVLARRVFLPSVPSSVRSLVRSVRRRPQSDPWDPIIHPEFARRANLRERIASLDTPTAKVNVRRLQVARLSGGLFQNVLELVNSTALAHGFHALYPYCDVHLMEFCVALPSAQKLRMGKTRFAMHQAMTQLPDEVRWRWNKTDVSSIVVQGMHRWHRESIGADALTPAPVLGNFLNLAYAKTAYQRYMQYPTEQDAMALWKTVMMSTWLRERPMTI